MKIERKLIAIGLGIMDWNQASAESLVIGGNDNYFQGYLAYLDYSFNITGCGNIFDFTTRESRVYTIVPTGNNDGSIINDTLSYFTYNRRVTVVFMPGTYDIDKTITCTNHLVEFIFHKDTIFELNTTSFVGTYMFNLYDFNSMSGPGILDGNGESGVQGVRATLGCVIDGLQIKDFNSYGINIAGKNTTVKNCYISNITSDAVYISSKSNCSVSFCKFLNITGKVINLISSHHCNIIYNEIKKIGMTNPAICIDTACNNNRIESNNIWICVKGVYIGVSTCKNNSIVNNNIFSATTGIHDIGTDTIIKDNHITCTTSINSAGTRPVIRDNVGYRTEAWGNTSVANNGTISHTLATTPIMVQLTCTKINMTAIVTTLSTTTFKVRLINIVTGLDIVGSYYIHWYAKV